MYIETWKKEQDFIKAYFQAIEFTENDQGTMPELCEFFTRENIIDCLAFYGRVSCYLSDDEIVQAGHDFWLTRNGHGTGFWDRDYKYKDLLTEVAESKAFGPVYPTYNELIKEG